MANDEQMGLFPEEATEGIEPKKGIPVAKVDFLEGQTLPWRELFEGFTSVKIITFSSSLDFLKKILDLFEDAEVIFGNPQVMSYGMTEIVAFQSAVIESVRNAKFRDYFLKRLKENTLRFYVAREKLSHEKLYLLSGKNGRQRVITGSANMSNRAFTGGQRENIVYMDGSNAYDWYLSVYDSYIADCTDTITEKAVLVSDDGFNMETLPVAETVQACKVLEIQKTPEDTQEIEFALKVNEHMRRLSSLAPKTDKNAGRILITPQAVHTLRQNSEKKREDEKAARQDYPMLHINVQRQEIGLNEKLLDLHPRKEEIQNDVSLFLQFMDGYHYFSGEWKDLQKRYYAFANWFFCSPFMAVLRNTARLYNVDRTSYPVFGVIYGQSKAGKTTFLKMLLKMMIGQSPIIAGKEFTKTVGDNLRFSVEGVPIVADDIMKTRFDQHAPELMKNEDFGYTENLTNYPAIVFSANTDMETIKPEYSRRAVCVNVSAGLSNENQRTMSTRIGRISRKMKTAMYREYLRRMLGKIPGLLEILKTEGDLSEIPDILNESSLILYDIISENSGEQLPEYICELQYNDYFGSSVLGKNTKEKIRRAWENNNKCFSVKIRQNELAYDTGDIYEPKRIRDELPESLEAKISRTKIIMRLDKAKEFFGINFRRTIFK